MILFKDAYVLNPGDWGHSFEFFKGDLLVKEGKIAAIYRQGHQNPPGDGHDVQTMELVDCGFRKLIFPGFVQSHIHCCQTLHRNGAEEMPLMQWLKQEIWPFEASHTAESMRRSVLMSLKEVLAAGTTAALDMGTVHHQDVIFQIMEAVGFRYTGGKAMMDNTEDCPEELNESTSDSIDESMRLYEAFHGGNDGLLHYAFAPRFVLSCSTELLQEVRRLSDQHKIIIHTHASEHPEEVAFIRGTHGLGNVAYLDKIGALNCHSVIAHMVHLDESEKELMKQYNISTAHCPTTNLKLGSGVAPIAEYLDRGAWVGLGSDGAPCNNSLSIFNELKLAPLLQKGVNNDHRLVSPEDALRLVSINGAKILRQADRIGKIQEGMDADLVVMDMDRPWTYNFEKNPAATLVYGADARNVWGTMVKGKFLFKEGVYSKEICDLERGEMPS